MEGGGSDLGFVKIYTLLEKLITGQICPTLIRTSQCFNPAGRASWGNVTLISPIIFAVLCSL